MKGRMIPCIPKKKKRQKNPLNFILTYFVLTQKCIIFSDDERTHEEHLLNGFDVTGLMLGAPHTFAAVIGKFISYVQPLLSIRVLWNETVSVFLRMKLRQKQVSPDRLTETQKY